MRVDIEIPQLSNLKFNVNLHVLPESTFDADIILDREFLLEQRFTLIFKPVDGKEHNRACLFLLLPLCVSEQESDGLKQTINDIQIDFDSKAV